jgi:hypothetical protein
MAATTVAAVGASAGGEIDLAWDPVNARDLAGYRIFFGTEPGPPYDGHVDVGRVTEATVSGLSDCTWYYLSVKARDSGGALSGEFSNEAMGYTHPEVVAVNPGALESGETATFAVTGSGFASGATPAFSGSGLTVESYSVDSCSQVTVQARAEATLAPGWRDVEVVNSDGGFGTLPQALRVDTPSCSVTGVTPSAGTQNVDSGTDVDVHFDCPVDPNRLSSKRLRIRRMGPPGRSTGNAKSSPRIKPGTSNHTVSLTLSVPLEMGQAYSVLVKGGSKGVRFMPDGGAMVSGYSQIVPFETHDALDAVTWGASEGSATTALTSGDQIPPESVIVVRFTEPMSASSVSKKSFKLKHGKRQVRLLGGRPLLSADGRSVILHPEDGQLPEGAFLDLQIKGGKRGVRTARGATRAENKHLISFSTSIGTVPSLGVAD